MDERRAMQLGDLFELVAAAVPDREALVCGGADGHRARATYAELDARADATARALAGRGVGPGTAVGLHLHNHAAHVESLLAVAKLRAVPVNLNTRYVAEELAYVLDDAGARVLLTERAAHGEGVEAARQVPGLHHVISVDEGWADEVASQPSGPVAVGERSADDLWLIYTGGTTGQPKGVMWRQEDLYVAALGGRGTPSQGVPAVTRPEQVVDRALGHDPIRRRLPFCPLIHGGALWIVLQSLLSGGTAVLSTDVHLDGRAAVDLLAGERIDLTMIIGDAVARPIADALAAEPGAHDLSALQVIASGGAVLSPAVADQLRALLPGVKVVDTFGASETGGQGRLRRVDPDGPPRLVTDTDSAVLDDDLEPVAVGQVGRLARKGAIPLGYWRDPERTAAAFPVIDGVRWSVPGDLARLEDDGSIALLGRGSTSINTGGEKVFPEEVEGVLKAHPAVHDALVVGVPDERFGQRVAAVVALRPGAPDPGDDALATHCRDHLAGYKVPRAWRRVERCERLDTGKPDYRWAVEVVVGSGSAR